MHKVYKLLRNNQQTGPYSLDELRTLGLKPFDLIWEEGRSGGWSYPSEIPALEPFVARAAPPAPAEAPAVREAAPDSLPEAGTQQVCCEDRTRQVPAAGRHIFVRMPGGAKVVSADSGNEGQRSVAEGPKSFPEEESPEQKLERKAAALRQRVQAFAEERNRLAEEPSLETKYARSLEDIKEEYAHWMQEQRHKGRRFRLPGKRPVRTTAALAMVLALVAVLVQFAPWGKASETGYKQQEMAPVRSVVSERKPDSGAGRQAAMPEEFTDHAVQLHALEDANELIAQDLERLSRTKAAAAVYAPEEPDYGSGAGAEHAAGAGEVDAGDEGPLSSGLPDREPVARTVRQSSGRTEAASSSLAQQIDVQARLLTSGRRRGISGLELTVQNNSDAVLKLVAVDVFYYREGDQLVAKETLYFNNLQPRDTGTLQAPGNKKANTARYQLGLISSEDGALYVVR